MHCAFLRYVVLNCIQNTESTASTAKRQVTLLALTAWQYDSLIPNNIGNTGRLVNLNTLGQQLNLHIISTSESHFLPDVYALTQSMR